MKRSPAREIMEALLGNSVVQIGLMAAGALAGFVVLRSALRATARLVKVGCLSLAGLALVIWLIGWVT